MKNMKVSLKLILGFVIVIIFAIIIGVVGIIGMTKMDQASTDIYQKQTVPIPYLAKAIENMQRMRVNMREYIISVDVNSAERREKAHNAIEESKKTMTECLDFYSATIVSAEARQLFDEAREIYENIYLPVLDQSYIEAQEGDVQTIVDEIAGVTDNTNKIMANFDRCMIIKTENAKAASDGTAVLARQMLLLIIGALVLAVAIAVFLTIYISGLISKPLTPLTSFMNQAGSLGDITFSREHEEAVAKYGQNKDEIGQCINAIAAFVKHISEISNELETVANGDLGVELKLLSERDTMGLSLQRMVENLNSMFIEINSATSQVSIGSKQIADGAQTLAQGSTEQASAVQQLSASIAEIANKTKQNAEMAEHAAKLAGNIKHNAEKGNMQMDQMMQAVREINEASQSINKVIKVIDDIAFQTNILALNAAVEAARAGQHGKGFAVVAEEVRNLAAKSAEAAKETGVLIANSMEKADIGSRIANDTASSLVEIVSGINESTQIVGDIARSSEEQSNAIMEINSGIDQVAQVVQQNSATAEESAAASQEMSGQADSLEELIAQFKLKDGAPRLGGRLQQGIGGRSSAYIAENSNHTGMGKY